MVNFGHDFFAIVDSYFNNGSQIFVVEIFADLDDLAGACLELIPFLFGGRIDSLFIGGFFDFGLQIVTNILNSLVKVSSQSLESYA